MSNAVLRCPTKKSEQHFFSGLCSFHHQFVFSLKCRFFSKQESREEQTKKVELNDEERQTGNDFLEKVIEAPVLALPRPKR